MENRLIVRKYNISSLNELEGVVDRIYTESKEYIYIQILAHSHHTDLIDNLTLLLKKQLSATNITLIQSEDENEVKIIVYSLDTYFTKDELLYHLEEKALSSNENFKDSKTQLVSKYFTDQLTGFPNLYQLRRDVQDVEDRTYICLTIDNFKLINDFYGFIVGDYILEQMILKLKNGIQNARVYRISGAEFGILIEETMDFYTLKNYLTELNDSVKNLSFRYQDSVIYTNVTLASSAGKNYENLFAKVSMALKYAKKLNLPFWIYEDRMDFENEYKLNILTSFRVKKAIESSGVVPYFQPIICNKTGKIVKFESLSRLIYSD